MTLETSQVLEAANERAVRAALLSRCGISAEDEGNIDALARKNNLSFVKAALQLNLVSAKDVEDAFEAAAEGSSTASFMETALKKLSATRYDIVVRENAPVAPGAQLVIAHEPYSDRSEKIRALRTQLLLLSESTRSANVIAVVSAGHGEGRSQLSAELAVSFAQLNRRTLLVDADMRSPQLHAFFGSENELGLSQALSLSETAATHPVIGLRDMRLLTAGPIPPNPLELLSAGRFQKLLGDWRRSYEFVVIDTPPISQFADGLAVATMAERALIVSRAQHTTYTDAKDMLRRLETTRAQVLGAVINHF